MNKLLWKLRPGDRFLAFFCMLLMVGETGLWLLTVTCLAKLASGNTERQVILHMLCSTAAAAVCMFTIGYLQSLLCARFGKGLRKTVFCAWIGMEEGKASQWTSNTIQALVLDNTEGIARFWMASLQTISVLPAFLIFVVCGAGFFAGDLQKIEAEALLVGTLTVAVGILWQTVLTIRKRQEARKAADVIRKLMETRAPDTDQSPIPCGRFSTLEFRHVTFRYPGNNQNALTDLSFQVNRGETFGILGPAGSGKTTILDLCAGLYTPTEGKILLNGWDLASFDKNTLRDMLGYVLQTPVLFSGTIEENVNFGESNAVNSREHTWLALSQTRANEYVERLPGGLAEALPIHAPEVPLEEKQRISIARALARNPELLLCDNAVSALKKQDAACLRAGLQDDLNGITKLVCSPDIASVRPADQILVLENGRAVGLGTHEQLIKTCRVYQELEQKRPEEGWIA